MASAAPWTILYQPLTPEDIAGQKIAIGQLDSLISQYKNRTKRAAILVGPTGTGKTSTAIALAKRHSLELIEVNASDVRNKDAINSVIGSALQQQSLFSKGKLVLVDEIDGLSGHQDRGGITALAALVSKSTYPIIMTANDIDHKKFKPLKKYAEIIMFPAVSYDDITAVLKNICDKENIDYEDLALKTLARRCGGDVRAAVNDLQSAASFSSTIDSTALEAVGARNHEEEITQALVRVFKTSKTAIAKNAFSSIDVDLDEAILWVEENLPMEYTSPHDRFHGFDKLSLADVFRGRIRRWQHWRFLIYVNALTSAGVAVAKEKKTAGHITYQRSKRILKTWIANQRYAKRMSIATKIGDATHCSKKEAVKSTVPYLKTLFSKDKKQGALIGEELDLDSDEIAWLAQ